MFGVFVWGLLPGKSLSCSPFLKTGTWPDLRKPVPVDSQPSALDYTPHALRKRPFGVVEDELRH